MKNTKVEVALEEIYQDSDQKITYSIYVLIPIIFIVGAWYNNPVFAALGISVVGAVFLYAKNYIQDREVKNLLISVTFVLFIFLLIFMTNGITESKYYYFSLLFFLVLYQNSTAIHAAAIVGYINNILTFSILLGKGKYYSIVAMHFLEPQGVSVERFVISLGAVLVAHFTAIFIAETLKQRTVTNLVTKYEQEEQLRLLTKNIEFAGEIANGNLGLDYEIEDEDNLGKALVNMRDSLKIATEKDQQDKFINFGVAEVGEILRDQTNNLEELADKLMSKIVNYLQASQGAIYLVEKKDDGKGFIDMIACYAYSRKKFLKKRIDLGEGLVGEVYFEKKPLFLKEIPKNYSKIATGLGESSPACIFIIPMINKDEVVGMIEIACLEELKEYEKQFIIAIAEDIASSITSVKVNEETKQLYVKSKQITEELQAQEEEMRQNMEELEATQEEMRRKQAILLESQTRSKAFFEEAINTIISFDQEGFIEEINPAGQSIFGYDEIDNKRIHIAQLIPDFQENGFENYVSKRNSFKAQKYNEEQFDVKVFLNKVTVGSKPLYILYARDITLELEQEHRIKSNIQVLKKHKEKSDQKIRNAVEKEKAFLEEIEMLKKELQQLKK